MLCISFDGEDASGLFWWDLQFCKFAEESTTHIWLMSLAKNGCTLFWDIFALFLYKRISFWIHIDANLSFWWVCEAPGGSYLLLFLPRSQQRTIRTTRTRSRATMDTNNISGVHISVHYLDTLIASDSDPQCYCSKKRKVRSIIRFILNFGKTKKLNVISTQCLFSSWDFVCIMKACSEDGVWTSMFEIPWIRPL